MLAASAGPSLPAAAEVLFREAPGADRAAVLCPGFWRTGSGKRPVSGDRGDSGGQLLYGCGCGGAGAAWDHLRHSHGGPVAQGI